MWPAVGKRYAELFKEVIVSRKAVKRPLKIVSSAAELPELSFGHIQRLTDDTGILQHATGIVPNRKEGYCIDDNSRALVMAVWHYRQTESLESLDLATTYLSYIQYSQKEDGAFHNFMDYQHRFLDTVGSEDSMGRTLWALGYTIRYCHRDALRLVATELFNKSKHICRGMNCHLRAKAFSILGMCHYLKRYPEDKKTKEDIFYLADEILEKYKENTKGDWHWFEKDLTYDNASLSLALLKIYRTTGNKKYLQVGLNSLNFLRKFYFKNNYLQAVGRDVWSAKEGEEIPFRDEQPIDVTACVLAFKEAYHCTKKKAYLDYASDTFAWFAGKNRLSIPLYDFESHGCFDGLQKDKLNQNEGAEASVSYLIALLTMIDLSHIEPVEEGSM